MFTTLKNFYAFVFISLFTINCSSGSDLSAGDTFCMDLDNDGFTALYQLEASDNPSELPIISCSQSFDCDDQSSGTFPGAIEILDNQTDENCDDEIGLSSSTQLPTTEDSYDDTQELGECEDGSSPITYYFDEDADGFGLTDNSLTSCDALENYVIADGDCDDTDATVYPGAQEITDDTIDQDCDGSATTSSCTDSNLLTYYFDADGDGYYDIDNFVKSCTSPGENYYLASDTTREPDCNDENAYAHPGMSGKDYGVLIYQQYPTQMTSFMNRSSNSKTSSRSFLNQRSNDLPQPETGIGTIEENFLDVDNDCDGQIDEDSTTENVPEEYEGHGVYYNTCDGEGSAYFAPDNDGDGYGDNTAQRLYRCRDQEVSGYVANNTDCNDNNENTNPSFTEDYRNYNGQLYLYANEDNDCDGEIDENGDHDNEVLKYSIAWNGHLFENSGDSNTQHKRMGSYFQPNFSSGANGDYSYNGKISYIHGGGQGQSYSYKYYFTTIQANQTYANFWYNHMKVMITSGSARIYFPEIGDGSPENLDYSCSSNHCTGTATLNLSEMDETGQSYAKEYYYGRKASIFLRGYQFNHDGSYRYFKSQHVEMWLQHADIDENNGTVDIRFKINIKGGLVDNIEATIPFTVMLYDPQKIKVVEFSRTNADIDYEDGERVLLQEKTFSNDLLDFQETSFSFNCSNLSNCLDQKHTVGSVIRSWGFDLDDTFKTNRIKALSYLKSWDNTTLTLKTQGVAKHNNRHTKAPNEMKSRVIVCANRNVCQMKFQRQSCSVRTQDNSGGFGFDELSSSSSCSASQMEDPGNLTF